MGKKNGKTAEKRMDEQVAVYHGCVRARSRSKADGKVLRAAIYTRCASVVQGQEQKPESIDRQVAACRQYAVEKGYTVQDTHVYEDVGIGGDKCDRPGIAALLAAARKGEFDLMIVEDLSRISRDALSTLNLVHELDANDVAVFSISAGIGQITEVMLHFRAVTQITMREEMSKRAIRGHANRVRPPADDPGRADRGRGKRS